jgi:hypothetical protein
MWIEGNAQYLCWVASIAARVLGEVGVGHAILRHVGVLVPVAHGSVLRWHLLHAWSCKWRLLQHKWNPCQQPLPWAVYK